MTFLERSIARAGFAAVLDARAVGDLDAVRGFEDRLRAADLLVLGAMADLVRDREVGTGVRIHVGARADAVRWIEQADGELELLRAVAIARLTGERRARIGVDWGRAGLELAQVALGFGASDLTGPIVKKSGLLVLEDETRKVKKQGLVSLASLKRQEIARLVVCAGRAPAFTDEEGDSAEAKVVEAMHA